MLYWYVSEFLDLLHSLIISKVMFKIAYNMISGELYPLKNVLIIFMDGFHTSYVFGLTPSFYIFYKCKLWRYWS